VYKNSKLIETRDEPRSAALRSDSWPRQPIGKRIIQTQRMNMHNFLAESTPTQNTVWSAIDIIMASVCPSVYI